MLKGLLRRSATLTASVLESGALALRGLAEQRDVTAEPAATPPTPATPPAPKAAPPAGTRSRISDPKAARRVRAREG